MAAWGWRSRSVYVRAHDRQTLATDMRSVAGHLFIVRPSITQSRHVHDTSRLRPSTTSAPGTFSNSRGWWNTMTHQALVWFCRKYYYVRSRLSFPKVIENENDWKTWPQAVLNPPKHRRVKPKIIIILANGLAMYLEEYLDWESFALKTTDFLLPSHIYLPILVNRLKFVWLRKAFELSVKSTKNKYTPRIKEYLLTQDLSKPDYLYGTGYVSPYWIVEPVISVFRW